MAAPHATRRDAGTPWRAKRSHTSCLRQSRSYLVSLPWKDRNANEHICILERTRATINRMAFGTAACNARSIASSPFGGRGVSVSDVGPLMGTVAAEVRTVSATYFGRRPFSMNACRGVPPSPVSIADRSAKVATVARSARKRRIRIGFAATREERVPPTNNEMPPGIVR